MSIILSAEQVETIREALYHVPGICPQAVKALAILSSPPQADASAEGLARQILSNSNIVAATQDGHLMYDAPRAATRIAADRRDQLEKAAERIKLIRPPLDPDQERDAIAALFGNE